MAGKYDKILYDTAVLVTSGTPKEFSLFQVPVGADSSHDEDETNNPYNGQVASEESMVIDKIEVHTAPDVTFADLQKIYKGAYLQIKVRDQEVFHGPLAALAPANGFRGTQTWASGTDSNGNSMVGTGYTLKNPIMIPGGARFVVRLVQFTAVAAASNLRVVLHAQLERKEG